MLCSNFYESKKYDIQLASRIALKFFSITVFLGEKKTILMIGKLRVTRDTILKAAFRVVLFYKDTRLA